MHESAYDSLNDSETINDEPASTGTKLYLLMKKNMLVKVRNR